MVFSRCSSLQREPELSTSTPTPSRARRQLRQLLRSRRASRRNGSVRMAKPNWTSQLPKNCFGQRMLNSQSSKNVRETMKNAWLRCGPAARMLVLFSTLLLLLMCASCAGFTPDVPPTLGCNVPLSHLEPTPQPPLNDATVNHLLLENEAVRLALEEANGDKGRVKQYILERCMDQEKP